MGSGLVGGRVAVTKGVMRDSFVHETVDVTTEKNHLFVAKALALRSERLDRVNRHREVHSFFESLLAFKKISAQADVSQGWFLSSAQCLWSWSVRWQGPPGCAVSDAAAGVRHHAEGLQRTTLRM